MYGFWNQVERGNGSDLLWVIISCMGSLLQNSDALHRIFVVNQQIFVFINFVSLTLFVIFCLCRVMCIGQYVLLKVVIKFEIPLYDYHNYIEITICFVYH